MPTSPASDVVPVARTTKALLASAKGRRTFDALLRELLRAVPPDDLRARLDAAERREAARLGGGGGPREPQRSPAKQRLLVDLAERAFADMLREGRAARLGPRRMRFRVRAAPRAGPEVKLARRPGRGLSP